MKEIIQFAGHTLEIWRRPRQRNMHLTVRADGRVRVTCNRRVAKRQVLAFVQDSAEFIAKRALEIENMKKRFPVKQVLSGERWLYLGQPVALEVIWTWTERVRVTGQIEVKAPLASTPDQRWEALCAYYRRQARAHLLERLRDISSQMGLHPRRVVIRGQNTRWGSCSAGGVVSLNWKLMAAPAEVIDYVIVHELAHLRHLNHSRNFWALVATHHPGYLTAKRWLREFEPEIGAQFRR